MGVKQDYAEAAKWYRKAADQGIPAAQNNLGVMYLVGEGVSSNLVRSYMWFNLAASRYPSGKKKDTAINVLIRLTKEMTSAQVAEAETRAREWWAAFQKRESR